MTGNEKRFTAALVVIVSLFVIGIYALLAGRIEKGDIYPHYSSFRSDPLGTKALYLAYGRLTGIEVRRNYLEARRLTRVKGATIYCLGADSEVVSRLSPEALENLERLAAGGNRLVIGFSAAENVGGSAPGDVGLGLRQGHSESAGIAPLTAKWGITLERFSRKGHAGAVPLRAFSIDGAADSVNIRSDIYFQTAGTSWRAVYSTGTSPVVIERNFGAGSIVLLSDSYPASNEALRGERYPRLLAWLQGGNRAAVFDEYHLGVREDPGIMWLIGKYRLEPLLVGLLLLGALFVWKNSVAFLPSRGSGRTETERGMADRDSISGLVSLLRRNIPPAELLHVCLREWEKSFSREYRGSTGLLKRIRSIVTNGKRKAGIERDRVEDYRNIARILAERKR